MLDWVGSPVFAGLAGLATVLVYDYWRKSKGRSR